MQKSKSGSSTLPKKAFAWGISSTSISFMQTNELQAARDGSAGDCGCGVSPLQQPKQKSQARPPRKA